MQMSAELPMGAMRKRLQKVQKTSAHVVSCVGVDVTVVKNHGTICNIDAAPLQSNDRLVKSEHPIGRWGKGRSDELFP